MFYILIAAGIFFGDDFIKKYIEENKEFGKDETICNGNIIINKHHNKGAMLNFMDKNPNAVLLVSGAFLGIMLLLFALILPKRNNRLLKLGMSFLVGGALSNVYDRAKRGYVVDYFSFKPLKKVIFNISDIFIFIGSFFVVLASVFYKKI